MGREVERLLDKTLGAGYHEARWDATGLPSGVYLYRIRGYREIDMLIVMSIQISA